MKIQGNKGTLLLSESTLFFVSVVFKGSFLLCSKVFFSILRLQRSYWFFNVPLLILRNKTLRKRVWKYPSWLNQKKSCLSSTAGSRCFESLLEKITGCCFHLTWSFYFRNIALKLESTSFSLAFPERQIKLRYLFGQVDRFETSIPNQKRGFNHVESRVCYFTVCVQGSCYSTEVNLYTLMPIDS